MKRQERVLATIRGERTDRIPKGEFKLEDGFVKGLLSLDQEPDREARIEACETLGLDVLAFTPSEFDAGNPFGKEDWAELKEWRKKTDFFMFAIVDGPFQGIDKEYQSFMDFLMSIAKNREEVHELCRRVSKNSLQQGLEALRLGADGIIIADDIAYQQGTYISPKALREQFFPFVEELVSGFREHKIPVFFHSDGNILQVLSDLRAMKFDGLHSIEHIMDFREVRRQMTDRCLMGGYDLGWFEQNGVMSAEWLLNSELAQGPYIFGSSAGILDSSLPVDKVAEVYEYVHRREILV